MNKLNLLLISLSVATVGCGQNAEPAAPSPVEEAAALEKQAEVQAAVGDKAGAEAMRAKAAALRAQAGQAQHAG